MAAPATLATHRALVQAPEERVEDQQGHAAEETDPEQQVPLSFGRVEAADGRVLLVVAVGVLEAVVYDAVGARVAGQVLEHGEPLVDGRLRAGARVVLVVVVVLLAVPALDPLAQVRVLLLGKLQRGVFQQKILSVAGRGYPHAEPVVGASRRNRLRLPEVCHPALVYLHVRVVLRHVMLPALVQLLQSRVRVVGQLRLQADVLRLPVVPAAEY